MQCTFAKPCKGPPPAPAHKMLDHLQSLSEVEFLPDVERDGAEEFVPLKKADANAQFDAKVRTADLLSSLGVVDDDEIAAPTAQKEATAAFTALVGTDEEARLEAVGALSLPESVRGAVTMLTQYQWDFVQQAQQLRSMAVSKIVAETDHPDARIRLKALQMLGNVTEVALFTERHEIKKTDMTTDEIEKAIRAKLAKFAAVADASVDDAIVLPSTRTTRNDP